MNGFGVSDSGLTNAYMENRDNSFLFTKHYDDYSTMGKGGNDEVMHDILKGIIELNDLSRFFFSRRKFLKFFVIRHFTTIII